MKSSVLLIYILLLYIQICYSQKLPFNYVDGHYYFDSYVETLNETQLLFDINLKYVIFYKKYEKKTTLNDDLLDKYSTMLNNQFVTFKDLHYHQTTFYWYYKSVYLFDTNDTDVFISHKLDYIDKTISIQQLMQNFSGILGPAPFQYEYNVTSFSMLLSRSNPYLYFDSLSNITTLTPISTESIPSYSPISYQSIFPIYHLSLCGASLFGDITTSYATTISTLSTCLILPTFIFENIIHWIPVTCASSNNTFSCYLNENWNPKELLPDFSFQLTVNGPKLYFSLSDLIYEENHQSKICIQKQSKEAMSVITLGTMILEHFILTFNYTDSHILFTPTSITPSNTNQCNQKPECASGQTYNVYSNQCDEPLCQQYFFMKVTSSHQCQSDIVICVLFWILLLALFCWEMGQTYQMNKLKAKLRLNKRNM